MATQMGEVYTAMTRDMGAKLSAYYDSLQSHYGNSLHRTASEQHREPVNTEHHDVAKTAGLLNEAYVKRTEANRVEHSQRMSKRQAGRNAASLPKSEQVTPVQTAPPRKQPAPRSSQGRPSAS